MLYKQETGYVKIVMDHLVKEDGVEEHTVVDLESGEDGFISSLNCSMENSSELLLLREEKKGVGEGKMGTLTEKPKKKKSPKKPPKPPRPPRGPSLDTADVKLMKEISELAMLKRARMERVKAMKNLKAAKAASSSSNSNLCAMVVTLLFCLVLLFQGLFSRGNSLVSFHGSPESTVAVSGGLISVKHYKNLSASGTVGLGP